jgi:hypothetical protein
VTFRDLAVSVLRPGSIAVPRQSGALDGIGLTAISEPL